MRRAATSFNENILSSCSAYGLAIQALGGAKITSSLLPQRIRREKMWQEKTRWFAAAAAIFVAAPLVAYGSILWGTRSLDDTAAIHVQNLQKKNTFKTYDSEWKAEVEDAGSGDRMRSQNYNSLQTGRDIQPTLISDIIACLPPIPSALATALESGDKAKLPPRASRNIVQIDRISMEYHPDMTPMLALPEDQIKTHEVASIAPKFGSNGAINRTTAGRQMQGASFIPPAIFIPGAAQNTAAPSAGGPLRGYVIDVICTTPRPDGASYVLSNFVSKLEKLQSSTPLVNYAVKKVREPYFTPVGNVTMAGGGAPNQQHVRGRSTRRDGSDEPGGARS